MTAPESTLEDIVGASPLGRGLSSEQVMVLAGLVALRRYGPSDVIAREGTVDDRLVVVVDGALDVVKNLGTPNESTLTTLHAGDLAHELGFLDGTPRYTTLVATSAARVLVLERGRLESLIETHPRILYAVMCAIVRTVHSVQTRLSVQATELLNYVVKQHGRY
ncbi:MAG: cyclic nucleotide-binding domain-containing protein [Caldimonas sp.]